MNFRGEKELRLLERGAEGLSGNFRTNSRGLRGEAGTITRCTVDLVLMKKTHLTGDRELR